MLREQNRKVTKRKAHRSATRFPGIGKAALALRVSRTHLWYVLTGYRESDVLLSRYHALMDGDVKSARAPKTKGGK